MRLCTVPGCRREHHAHGLCQAHLRQQARRARGLKRRQKNPDTTAAAMKAQAAFVREQRAERLRLRARLIAEQLPPSRIRERMGESAVCWPDVKLDNKTLRSLARKMGKPLKTEYDMNWEGVA